MFCSRCGTEVQDKSKFCPACGLDLMATTPIQAIVTGDVTELDIVREALDAEYEVAEELGRGGMAIVYRARDRQLEREVAIKVLPFSLAFDAEFVERFQREARTAAQLEHPNIIPIYRVGRSGRVIYFVMKFLRGKSLSQLLVERKRLPPPEIRRLLIEAGSALGYAAQRGIVHRDIKPDNILFDEHGQCVVSDFGIAKAASGQKLTGTGMSIGTPHYMSPEQARAQNIDGRSDIYSLGIVAYQCLAGEVPYDGEDNFAIGYKHIMEPIPTPSLATPDERRLFEIIKRMIMKEPRERFQDSGELLTALDGQPSAPVATSQAGAAAVPAPTVVATAVTQPTRLPPRPADAVVMPPTTPEVKRAVAPRTAARVRSRSRAGLWAALLVLIAGGGTFYWSVIRAPQETAGTATDTDSGPARADSLLAATKPADSVARPDSVRSDTPTTATAGPSRPPPRDSVAAPSTNVATRGGDRVGTGSVPERVDSGGIRVRDLPIGSTVLIDEEQTTKALTWLPPGPHVIAISAPRHQFYTDTILVRAGQIAEVRPTLVRLGVAAPPTPRPGALRPPANCDAPGPRYNSDGSCYDVRPRPVAPTFVPVSEEVEGIPRASVLLIKVAADGKTLDVRPMSPSNDPAFERLAQAFAMDIEWHPATKGGLAVEGWTQWAFPPLRQ